MHKCPPLLTAKQTKISLLSGGHIKSPRNRCLLTRFLRYEDGSIKLWDAKISSVVVSFNGHRSAVTTLAFDKAGTRLASGGKDTDIIVWDLVAEVGLFKLRGHKDQIVALNFIEPPGETAAEDGVTNGTTNDQVAMASHDGFLLTAGKDSLIKIWDVAAQHCIETHIAQTNGECWALGVSPDQSGCITAGNDGELRIWSLDLQGLSQTAAQVVESRDRRFLLEQGTLYRQGKDRPYGISFHPKADYFAVHGSEKAVEIWRIRSQDEVQKGLSRKRKRRREKAAATTDKQENEVDRAEEPINADASEVFVPYVVVRTGGKVQSADWAGGRASKVLRLLTATTNNLLEIYDIPANGSSKASKSDEPPDYSRMFAVDLPGHRADVRSVALSSDDAMLASASSGSLKIWNVKTASCIRTFECGYALCCSFLPGDKIVAVGTKSGTLELFDVASSAMIESTQAHDGSIWTLQVHPDGKGVVTGSADKSAKFWNFQIVQEDIPGTRRTTPRLRLVHSRTLKVTDEMLNLRFSPDSRLLALALLDNTVKIFFVDTLKLFLNLYGHKLPVLNMDISHDSKLIVTCSADKNVRIWGLDFGDCHKALFAHQDSIMQVAFVPNNVDGNGHHFFSASKDRVIKYWDGDKFEQIQKLEGHHGEIWTLAVSRTGDFFVSASHDKSIRVWAQTDEQIFLEEEREKELEELYENTLTTSLEQEHNADGDKDGEVTAAGKQTVSTLMAGEKIAEALELGLADLEAMRAYDAAKVNQPSLAPPARHPLFVAQGNISAETHVLATLQKIPAAALQDALLVLSFAIVPALFTFLDLFARHGQNIPLTCRILAFMLKTHHKQIVASKMMRPMLEAVRGSLRAALGKQKDVVGYNLAALRVIGMRVKEGSEREFFVDGQDTEVSEKGVTKRGFVDVA